MMQRDFKSLEKTKRLLPGCLVPLKIVPDLGSESWPPFSVALPLTFLSFSAALGVHVRGRGRYISRCVLYFYFQLRFFFLLYILLAIPLVLLFFISPFLKGGLASLKLYLTFPFFLLELSMEISLQTSVNHVSLFLSPQCNLDDI